MSRLTDITRTGQKQFLEKRPAFRSHRRAEIPYAHWWIEQHYTKVLIDAFHTNSESQSSINKHILLTSLTLDGNTSQCSVRHNLS